MGRSRHHASHDPTSRLRCRRLQRPGADHRQQPRQHRAVDPPSPQSTWTLSIGDLLVAIGICVLYLEILKATRTSAAAVLDHALSIIVFVICLLEFLLIPQMGTASFFLITLMTFVDVIAGFTVTISAARRDVGLGGGLR